MKKEDAEEFTQSLGQIVGGSWRLILQAQQLGVPKALGLSVDEWVKKHLGGYIKLAVEERKAIVRTLTKGGMSQQAIGRVLGIDQATVSRDANASDAKNENIENKPLATPADANASPIDAVAALAADEEIRAKVIQDEQRERNKDRLRDLESREVEDLSGEYEVIVIDPPWPIAKIEREKRPRQVAFDYPTMDEEQLAELSVPCGADCHVWLWATQKYLPAAFRLLECWDLKYVATFVWHKPGGFQPFGLPQYNCEFALYARRGSPLFIDLKDFPLCFDAPRGGHSEKPEEFYARLRRVTAGRRLDMFNRRVIEGFTGWGSEAPTEIASHG